jgi:hypothetical protein
MVSKAEHFQRTAEVQRVEALVQGEEHIEWLHLVNGGVCNRTHLAGIDVLMLKVVRK